jgi:S1-C subfamily serine protease
VDTTLRARAAPHRATVARKGVRKIFVSPEMIRRAVPASGRPAAAWSPRTAEHPAGMMISSPGALGGTILAGDVIYEAEGQALGSPEQLVSVVMQAYRRNARFVSGRLWRHGEAWVLTVEPGWVPPRTPTP